MPHHIYVLNGPNLNLLGERQPEIYGHQTLGDIEAMLEAAKDDDVNLVFRQTNEEGELVNWLQEARRGASAVILNAAAYTHTSIAIYDALQDFPCPIIEVHLSNPYAREVFRHTNYVSPAATGTIAGFGAHGYILALEAALVAAN